MDWLDLLAAQGTLKSLIQHHNSKASVLQCSTFFIIQLTSIHDYSTGLEKSQEGTPSSKPYSASHMASFPMNILITSLNKSLESWLGTQKAADQWEKQLVATKSWWDWLNLNTQLVGSTLKLEKGDICTKNTQSFWNKYGLRWPVAQGSGDLPWGFFPGRAGRGLQAWARHCFHGSH